jgi:DMSO/TMAO reductase YedYZ molybdopterin-dependent catalytic subunit
LRLIVPTWTGNHWVKWVKRITASAEESPSDFQRKSYKMPTLALPPSVAPTPDQLKSVTSLNVKSQLTWPTANSQIPAQDNFAIRGSAWTGPGLIARVEVRTSVNSTWQPAQILTPKLIQGAWVRWEFTIANIKAGDHFVEVRATDSNGQTQPVDPFWNRSGYLYNAIERVPFQVIG